MAVPLAFIKAKEEPEYMEKYLSDVYKDLQYHGNFGTTDPQTLMHINIIITQINDLPWTLKMVGGDSCTSQHCLYFSQNKRENCLDFLKWLPVTKDHQGCQRRNNYNEGDIRRHGQKSEYIGRCCMLSIGPDKLHLLNSFCAKVLCVLFIFANHLGKFDAFQDYIMNTVQVTDVRINHENNKFISIQVKQGNDRRSLCKSDIIKQWLPSEIFDINELCHKWLSQMVKLLLQVVRVYSISAEQLREIDPWEFRTQTLAPLFIIIHALVGDRAPTPYMITSATMITIQMQIAQKMGVSLSEANTSGYAEALWKTCKFIQKYVNMCITARLVLYALI